MSITINLPPELESQLHASSAASGVPPEEIVVDALSNRLLHPSREPALSQSPRLSAEESELFKHINAGFSEYEWRRYHELIERRRAETLTPAEQQELIAFTDRREAYNVKRLEKLIELARLRGATVDQVMDQLGIRPAFYD